MANETREALVAQTHLISGFALFFTHVVSCLASQPGFDRQQLVAAVNAMSPGSEGDVDPALLAAYDAARGVLLSNLPRTSAPPSRGQS